jgi:hypothetical protein
VTGRRRDHVRSPHACGARDDWSLGGFLTAIAPGDQERHVNLSLTIFWRSGAREQQHEGGGLQSVSVTLVLTATVAGFATVFALSSFGIGLALLCAPLVASCLTAIAAVPLTFKRTRRHGIVVGN